ncbi:MAG: HAMP domain-containing histidine kinase [Flavobacteriales bacterium]|jgi:signal transduction histidine kinase|nr:HAMP domain-containing histidine kinase [Flavobacteriales bacterium]MBK6755860.1 HAMP domain-containing histidine kinase [Flavobacteriales bacterium]MBK7270521.1 HAMP domain-containing histidine kinase [Flavobacteriales bacterium]MBK7751531.1 HAMP domain-containing histidine kinase [Flavobacteriales bacterium]MBK9073871.1 HAMP domain-containing histidine kinase [Flavobacteriales bacterium]
MENRSHRRTLLLFGTLAVYIILQSFWWAYLLIRKDQEMQAMITAFNLRPDFPGTPADRVERTFWMVVGEGFVFLALLLTALVLTYRAVRRDLELARAQRNFLLAITHELRTPLAGAKLQLQTLLRPDLGSDQRKTLIERGVRDLDRLSALTDRVLMAARMEESAVPLDLRKMDVVPLVREIVDHAVRGSCLHHHVDLALPPTLELCVEPLALRSILENLMENAGKYSPNGTEVRVDLAVRGSHAELSVTDRGDGVREADRAHIFRMFHRGGQEETRNTKGTGLGLYIARRLAHRMGGDMYYRPNVPRGSIFTAVLPLP